MDFEQLGSWSNVSQYKSAGCLPNSSSSCTSLACSLVDEIKKAIIETILIIIHSSIYV